MTAERLLDEGRAAEALPIVEKLHKERPEDEEVLVVLSNVYLDIRDMVGYQRSIEKLFPKRPEDPDLHYALAGAYLENHYVAKALQTFRRAVERFPDHEKAESARELIAEIEKNLPEIYKDARVDNAGDPFEILLLHEEIQNALAKNDFTAGQRAAEELLRRKPDYTAARNNLSLMLWQLNRIDEAIEHAEKVVELRPDNTHALVNLVRFNCLKGRLDTAKEWGEQLRQAEVTTLEHMAAQAEAWSYLGEDQEVLDLYDDARPSIKKREGTPVAIATLSHLTAVAALRQDDEELARRLWRQIIKETPWYHLATENLEDLENPPGDRHAPWPFELNVWLQQKDVSRLKSALQKTAGQDEEAIARSLISYFEENPDIANLIPVLLDRGDPLGRKLAFGFAVTARTPEMLEGLKSFVLSPRGPDELRMKAGEILRKEGLLPLGPISMYIGGKKQKLVPMSIEIYFEANEYNHSPYVKQLISGSLGAMRSNDVDTAQELLEEAIELEPDAPDIRNNLASCYQQKGHLSTTKAMLSEIHRDYPDYFFARTGLASMAILEGDLERAEELLRPLQTMGRMHISEFASFCGVNAQMANAKGEIEAVESWLDMWEQVDPDNPQLRHLRNKFFSTKRNRGLFWR